MGTAVAPPAAGGRGVRRTVAAGLASYLDASLLVTVAVALPVRTRHHDLSLWLNDSLSDVPVGVKVLIDGVAGGGAAVVYGIDAYED